MKKLIKKLNEFQNPIYIFIVMITVLLLLGASGLGASLAIKVTHEGIDSNIGIEIKPLEHESK